MVDEAVRKVPGPSSTLHQYMSAIVIVTKETELGIAVEVLETGLLLRCWLEGAGGERAQVGHCSFRAGRFLVQSLVPFV